MSQLFEESSPMVVELVGLFFLSSIITGLIVVTDIVFHDNYVGVAIEICHAENQELLCKTLRERLFLPADAQIEIGSAYWMILQIQAVTVSLAFGGFRALMIAGRRLKLTALRLFTIILWATIPFIFFAFGTVDVFYYLARGNDIPDTLPWLNDVGFLNQTKVFGNDPITVERSDLLFTFGIGILFIVALFFFATKMYQRSGLRGMV